MVNWCVQMEAGEPERLPPPPFWRTRYFAFDVLPRRPYLDPLEIRRIVAQPERRSVQRDGRIRLHGYSVGMGMLSSRCAIVGRGNYP